MSPHKTYLARPLAPRVTVVIPTFNRAASIHRALASALNQTFREFEILVVDDGSTDNTRDVVSGFNDARVRYIRAPVNGGDAAARNIGIKNSRSEYVAFLDDDDEWSPDKLRRQVLILDHSAAAVAAVYTGRLVVDDIAGTTWTIRAPESEDDPLRHNIITTSSVMVKTRCFDEVGLFDEQIPYCSDFDMWVRLSQRFRLKSIRDPLVKYHIHSGNLSANYALMIQGQEALLRKHREFFASENHSYSWRYLELGVLHGYNGDTRSARLALMKAVRLYPWESRHYFNLGLSLLGAGVFKALKDLRASGLRGAVTGSFMRTLADKASALSRTLLWPAVRVARGRAPQLAGPSKRRAAGRVNLLK